MHSTTIICVRKGDKVALAGDGQVTLGDTVIKHGAKKIRRLYIAILSRPPSEEEFRWMLDEVNLSGDEAWPNIVSALVMSSEFLFVQ